LPKSYMEGALAGFMGGPRRGTVAGASNWCEGDGRRLLEFRARGGWFSLSRHAVSPYAEHNRNQRGSLGGFEVEASSMEIMALVGIGLLFATLGVALGAVLGRYVWPAGRVTDAAALVEGQLEIARLTERLQSLTTQMQEEVERTRWLEAQRAAASDEAKTAIAQVARLTERELGLNVKIAEQAQQLVDLQKQLTTEFENIANRILKASASELSEGSQKALSLILDPLRERIQDFQKKVETAYDAETREVLSLKEQIKLIMETSHAIGSQADGLAKALRGDSQLRGRWGELALERILESAGLTEGREYITQGRGLGLKSEGGGVQRPDVIVILPEQRTMIIDSKLSLTGYERLIAAGDEVERNTASDQFIRDVKAHIDELAGKRYQENAKLIAHDCVLMFIPIEGALAAALTEEPELFTYAWNRHVVLVGPPTLLMTMRTVASIWRYELQGQNAQEIARLAGELCDKVSTSLGDLNTVAERIQGALAAHNEAVKRLATGRGNAVSIGDRIRNLGVKTRRPTPMILVDGGLVPPESDVVSEAAIEDASVEE
jgi:DNA recombination protein RmuC